MRRIAAGTDEPPGRAHEWLPDAGEKEPPYPYVLTLDREAEDVDAVRLFYVADTRAQPRLHLLGCVKANDDDALKMPSRRCLLGLGWNALGDRLRLPARTAPQPEAQRSLPAGDLKRLPVDLERASNLVATTLKNAITHERGRWPPGPHSVARNELRLRDREHSFRIDRYIEDVQGTKWVADYKLSEHSGADVEGFLDRERKRYAAQLNAYAEAIGDAAACCTFPFTEVGGFGRPPNENAARTGRVCGTTGAFG